MKRRNRISCSARDNRLFFTWVFGLAVFAVGWGTLHADSPDLATASQTLPQVGDPLAPGIVALLQQEIVAGLKTRQIEDKFSRFQKYASWKLDSTAGRRATSEVTGNCRLSWYDRLLRNPITAPAEAEQFTRQLHQSLLGDHHGLDRVLSIARDKMDLDPREPRTFSPLDSPREALEAVEQALTAAQLGHAAALAPLTRSQVGDLSKNLYTILTSQTRVGHALSLPSTGRRMCDLLEKIDSSALYSAAEALVPLSDPGLLEQLAKLPRKDHVAIAGVEGPIADYVLTSAGDILIGGPGKNTYQLDAMPDVSAVIDLGGDDVYHEGTVSIQRPVLIIIDLEGNDSYQGTKPGIQGSAVLGISMLIDAAGNDVYQARDVAQGSCLGGAGILIDNAGDDYYLGLRRVQGQAIGGLGILLDRDGNDRYRGAMWTQGFAGPLGFAVLDDVDGQDHYYTGGLYPDSYEETPGYEGWGQGVGAGLRGVSNGGIGVILDGGGDDVYEFDYLAHGGGYWLGMGFARDFGGNDRRLAATSKTYSGGTRREKRYQRFGCGFGCHYALGFCIDDQGDDSYHGTIMGLGFAWDCAVAALCDFAGNDRYETTSSSTQGTGAQAGLGILYDYAGDDVYRGYGQGTASSSISYHTLPQCGGNFSFVVDYGGTDKYGCGAKNDSYNRRTSSGGFLIDRPSRSEKNQTAERPASKETAGS